jgi:hypothetical protein
MADDLKKKLVQYGDKVLFGVFLVVLAATAVLTQMDKKPQDPTTIAPPKTKEPEETVAKRLNDVINDFDNPAIPEGYVTGGFASDYDEITPGPGEKSCPRCAWICKASDPRCPRCGYLFEDDDDKDGMPNEWEDRYKGTDRYVPDAEKDPDGDGFSNYKEYLGGSNPDDPKSIPSPFKVVNMYRKPVDVLFKGYTVKEGGDPDNIDPKYWVLQINYGRDSQTTFIPLGGYFRGYKLYPLDKRTEHVEPGHGIPGYDKEVYTLSIERKGQDPIKLDKGVWGQTNETFIDLEVTRGRDSGKVFKGVTIGIVITANGQRYMITEVRGDTAILKGSEGEVYTLQ